MAVTAADLLTLFETADVHLSVSADGQKLHVEGPKVVVEAAEPKLTQQRTALLAELQRRVATALDA